MKFLTSLLLFVSLSFADTVIIDHNRSSVHFKVNNMWLNHVRGSFSEFDAKIVFDTQTHLITSCKATVETASLKTSNASRDETLRSKEYLQAEYFPQMRFEMNEIFNDHIVGYMTILDKTKPISIKINKLDVHDHSFTLELEGELSRDEFGITKRSHFIIGKMVQFTIIIQGTLDGKTTPLKAAAASSL